MTESSDKWQRANLLFAEKQYTKAADLLADLVEQYPANNAARLLLARAYYHSAQLRRAEEQLRVLVERDPVDDYAHLMLGRCLERQGRAPEGAAWLRIADAFTPTPDTQPPAKPDHTQSAPWRVGQDAV